MKKRQIKKIYDSISQWDLLTALNVSPAWWQKNGRNEICTLGAKRARRLYKPYKLFERELKNEKRWTIEHYGKW